MTPRSRKITFLCFFVQPRCRVQLGFGLERSHELREWFVGSTMVGGYYRPVHYSRECIGRKGQGWQH